MGFMSIGSGWVAKKNGVNHAPSAVTVKIKKIRAEIKFFRNVTGFSLDVKRSFFLSPIKNIPKNGVRVRQAQNAKRSYVSHSQASPKKRRGSGVVPPRPSRKKMLKEMSRPTKRCGHLRNRNGMIATSGP